MERSIRIWLLIWFFRKTVFSVKGWRADTYTKTSCSRWNSYSKTVFSKNELKKCVARQDPDCTCGNKDVRIEATLLIPRQQFKLNKAVKSCRKTALIWLFDTNERFDSSSIDRIPRRGQIVCLDLDLNQNSNLHRISHHKASWTELEVALSELNAWRIR